MSSRSQCWHWFGRALVAWSLLAVSGCGASPITPARIERAIAPTFANLVRLQVQWLGLPVLTASEISASASCRKLVAGSNAGAGEWVCTVVWKGPDKQTLTDSYDLFVTTEGCYTATVATENLGGPMLRAADGREVRNLLYAFEGCFDTSATGQT